VIIGIKSAAYLPEWAMEEKEKILSGLKIRHNIMRLHEFFDTSPATTVVTQTHRSYSLVF